MNARMPNPALTVPAAMPALLALGKAAASAAGKGGVTPGLLALMNLRASQINGCSVCVDLHAGDARKADEPDRRVAAVAAWRETPWFTDAERAALALTEAVTRLSDRADPVPDAVYDAAAGHFDEATLSALILNIASVNVWNRLNASTRQIAGASW